MRLLSIFSILVVALAFGTKVYAQNIPVPTYQSPEKETEPVKGFDPSKLVFGGNFGGSFGNFTFINVSPQVGYRFTPHFIAGGGINFIYQSQKYGASTALGNTDVKESLGYAGLNVFARVLPVNFLFVSAQPEVNYNWGKVKYMDIDYPSDKLEGKIVPSFLVGGGLVLGRGMMISAQYDLLQNARSPYGDRVFFGFGFMF